MDGILLNNSDFPYLTKHLKVKTRSGYMWEKFKLVKDFEFSDTSLGGKS